MEEDFSALPLTDRWVHKKVWKVRKAAYEEAAQQFAKSPDENDAAFRPFLSEPGLWKGAVADSNVAAQQDGIASLCAFLKFGGKEQCTRTRGYTIQPLAEKGLPSTRPAIKASSLEALLLYIELDVAAPVIDELLPILNNKVPKTVAATLVALTCVIHNYGCKTVDPKPVLKALPKVFGHADKNVRAEATNLTVELYRWLRDAMKPMFWNELKPTQQTDLEAQFEKVADPPTQQRMLRSQTEQPVEEEVAAEEPEMDAFDLAEPQDIKVPPSFFDLLGSTKWKERKEALEALFVVVNIPRIKDADFHEVTRALAKCMKDANIAVVTNAAQCLEAMGKGLRNAFGKYRSTVTQPIMERLKEKKASVADALGAALDQVFASTSLSDCLEDILEYLKHKNPQVKEGTMKFLIRCLRTTRDVPGKPEIASMVEGGKKLLSESSETLRSGGAEVLGTLMKMLGERAMTPYLDGLDEIRKTKIKEFYEVAEVKAKEKPAAKAPKSAPKVVKKVKTPKAKSPPPELAPQPTARRLAMPRTLKTPKKSPEPKVEPKVAPRIAKPEAPELDDLRRDRDRLMREVEELRSDRSRLKSEVQELTIQNAQLIEDHTRDVLSIKAKETQLVRARSDAEAADAKCAQMRREMERLKRALTTAERDETPEPAESWKRAAEVTNALKLKIEQMKTVMSLVAWATSHGGYIHPDVEIVKDDTYGWSLRTTSPLPPHTRVVACPFALSLSHRNSDYNLPPRVASQHFLVDQYLLGDKSFWYPYIATLPQPSDDLPSPLFGDQDWLRGTILERAIADREAELRAECVSNFALYKWAAFIFSSRSFVAPGGAVLFPLMDIPNHSPRADVTWFYDDHSVNLWVESASDGQIFNNYAPKNNTELFLGYGFVLPDNDVVTVTCNGTTIHLKDGNLPVSALSERILFVQHLAALRQRIPDLGAPASSRQRAAKAFVEGQIRVLDAGIASLPIGREFPQPADLITIDWAYGWLKHADQTLYHQTLHVLNAELESSDLAELVEAEWDGVLWTWWIFLAQRLATNDAVARWLASAHVSTATCARDELQTLQRLQRECGCHGDLGHAIALASETVGNVLILSEGS